MCGFGLRVWAGAGFLSLGFGGLVGFWVFYLFCYVMRFFVVWFVGLGLGCLFVVFYFCLVWGFRLGGVLCYMCLFLFTLCDFLQGWT